MVDIRLLFSVIMTFVVLISSSTSASDAPCNDVTSCTGCDIQFFNNTRPKFVHQCLDGYTLTGYVIKRCDGGTCAYECFNLTNPVVTSEENVMNFTANENNISLTCHNGLEQPVPPYIYCNMNGTKEAVKPECTLQVNPLESKTGLSVTVKWILIIITTLAASLCISSILAILCAIRKRKQDIPWTRQHDDNSPNKVEVTSHVSMVTNDDERFIGESVEINNAEKPEAHGPDLLDKQADIDVVSNRSDETNQSVNDEIIKDNKDGSASNDGDTQIKTDTKESVNGGIANESKHGKASDDDIIQITTETNVSVNDEITKDNGHMGASGDGDTKMTMTTENSSKEVAESDDDSNNTYDTIVSGKTPKRGISISDKQDSEDTVYDHLHARAKAEATNNVYSHMAELREITNYNADYAYVVKRGTERDIVVHNMEQIDDTSFSSKATQSETRSPNYDPEDSIIEADAEEDATEQDEEDAYSQILF